MTKYLSIIFSILAVLVFFTGCSRDSNEIKTSWGQQFTLASGQTAVFENGSLKIKFDSVTGDNRCPKGVTCIQAGEARCHVLIGNDSYFSLVELQDKSGQAGYSEAVFKNGSHNLKLSFRVEPYPEAGKQIMSSDYKLKLTVTKGD